MRATGRIHHAILSRSPRLQALLALLIEVGSLGATTRQIIDAIGICAVNSAVSELRRNGYAITCVFEGRSPTGSSVFRYRLAPMEQAAE